MKKKEIRLTSVSDAYDFANKLIDSSKDEFLLTNSDDSKQSDPKTSMGIIYAMSEFDKIYLVNETNDGVFPDLD